MSVKVKLPVSYNFITFTLTCFPSHTFLWKKFSGDRFLHLFWCESAQVLPSIYFHIQIYIDPCTMMFIHNMTWLRMCRYQIKLCFYFFIPFWENSDMQIIFVCVFNSFLPAHRDSSLWKKPSNLTHTKNLCYSFMTLPVSMQPMT